eukprot:TRINITY_DN5422_c0_g1_i1.p1 TRINITY_DN5422_c0_g1~~TRINITY_DN5422_c0_g1_i1.p1  ORF type:complete len:2264 (+),score=725.83 TRINITY_DN5422_c0_g1_i1:101-6892(+)
MPAGRVAAAHVASAGSFRTKQRRKSYAARRASQAPSLAQGEPASVRQSPTRSRKGKFFASRRTSRSPRSNSNLASVGAAEESEILRLALPRRWFTRSFPACGCCATCLDSTAQPAQRAGRQPCSGLGLMHWTHQFRVMGQQGRNLYNWYEAPLGCIPPKSGFRVWIVRVIDSRHFDAVVLLAIALNVVCEILNIPSLQGTPVQRFAGSPEVELGFTIVFACEMVLKICGMGFVCMQWAYLRDPWNVIDCFIVTVGVASLFLSEGGNVAVIRLFRLARPLRAIRRIKNVRVLVNTIVKALPMMADVLMMLLLLMYAFAVLGMQLFIGVQNQRCYYVPADGPAQQPQLVENDTDVCGYRECAEVAGLNVSCEINAEVYRQTVFSFNNIWQGILLVFKVVTLDDWPEDMHEIQDGAHFWAWTYFVALTGLGGFLQLNLVLAILVYTYSDNQRKKHEAEFTVVSWQKGGDDVPLDLTREEYGHRIEQAQQWIMYVDEEDRRNGKTRVRRRKGERSQLLCAILGIEEDDVQTKDGQDGDEKKQGDEDAEGEEEDEEELKQQGIYVPAELTAATRLGLIGAQLALCPLAHPAMAAPDEDAPRSVPSPPASAEGFREDHEEEEAPERVCNGPRLRLEKVVHSSWFECLMLFVTLANVLVMATDHHGAPDVLISVIDMTNLIASWCFLVEMLLKMGGFGLRTYFDDSYNILDFVLVLMSIPELLSLQSGLQALLAFRAFRGFRLMVRIEETRRVVGDIVHSFTQALPLLLLMFILILIFALLGLGLFRGVFTDPADRENFESFWEASVTSFVVITGDGWCSLMKKAMDGSSGAAFLYFVSLFCLGNLILTNLFVAILIQNFSAHEGRKTDIDAVVKPGLLRRVSSFFGSPKNRRKGVSEPQPLETEGGDAEQPDSGEGDATESSPIAGDASDEIVTEEATAGAAEGGTDPAATAVKTDSGDEQSSAADGLVLASFTSALLGSNASVWRRGISQTHGRPYWYHVITGERTWVRPTCSSAGSGGTEASLDPSEAERVARLLPPPAQPRPLAPPGVGKDWPAPAPASATASSSALPSSTASSFCSVGGTFSRTSGLGTLSSRSSLPAPERAAADAPGRAHSGGDVAGPLFTFDPDLCITPAPAELDAPESPLNPVAGLFGNRRRGSGASSAPAPTASSGGPEPELGAQGAGGAEEERAQSPPVKSVRFGVDVRMATIQANPGELVRFESVDSLPDAEPPPGEGEEAGGDPDRDRTPDATDEMYESGFAHKSLGIFPMESPVRRALYRVVYHRWFDDAMVCIITVNAVFLALDDAYADQRLGGRQLLDTANVVFVAIFLAEAAAKIVVMGCVGLCCEADPDGCPAAIAYLRGASFADGEHATSRNHPSTGTVMWNRVDCLVAVAGLLDVLGVPLASIFRCMRTLRILARLENLRVVVMAMGRAMPQMLTVGAVCMFVFLVFGILGVSLFKGRLYHCTDATVRLEANCTGNYSTTEANATSSAVAVEVARDWENHQDNFDNVALATLTLFEVAVAEGWAQIMWTAVDATAVGEGPVRNNQPFMTLFFVLFIIVGNFFCVNMFIGSLINKFSSDWEKLQTEKQKQHNAVERLRSMYSLDYFPPRPKHWVAALCYKVVMHRFFSKGIIGAILLNAVLMGTQYYGMSGRHIQIMYWLNFGFVLLFTAEAAVKMAAFQVGGYFRDPWNRFDFACVGLSLIGVIFTNLETDFVRIARIGRMFRLLGQAQRLQMLFRILIRLLPAAGNVVLLMLFIFFNWGVVGVGLFKDVRVNEDLRHFGFKTLPQALIVLYTLCTSETWVTVMSAASVQPPDCSRELGDCGSREAAIIFFVSFMIVGSFVFINLFIFVVLNSFENDYQDTQDAKADASGSVHKGFYQLQEDWQNAVSCRTGGRCALSACPRPTCPQRQAALAGEPSPKKKGRAELDEVYGDTTTRLDVDTTCAILQRLPKELWRQPKPNLYRWAEGVRWIQLIQNLLRLPHPIPIYTPVVRKRGAQYECDYPDVLRAVASATCGVTRSEQGHTGVEVQLTKLVAREPGDKVGWLLDTREPRVIKTAPHGAAAAAGITPGMMIERIGEAVIRTPADVAAALRSTPGDFYVTVTPVAWETPCLEHYLSARRIIRLWRERRLRERTQLEMRNKNLDLEMQRKTVRAKKELRALVRGGQTRNVLSFILHRHMRRKRANSPGEAPVPPAAVPARICKPRRASAASRHARWRDSAQLGLSPIPGQGSTFTTNREPTGGSQESGELNSPWRGDPSWL